MFSNLTYLNSAMRVITEKKWEGPIFPKGNNRNKSETKLPIYKEKQENMKV